MAVSQTDEQVDAIYRVRAEVRLLIGKYERRLKKRAEDIALARMIADPTLDPDEVGREAFEQAGVETALIEGASAKALPASK